MSHTERVTAIVLDRAPYQEYDRIYTLLTLERGLVRARARGAAKTAAKVRPHLESFGLVDVMLVRGRGGLLLASAELREPYRMPTPEAYVLGAGILKLLGRVLREATDDSLFVLVRELLWWLSRGGAELVQARQELLKIELHFLWSLLGLLGYNATDDRCGVCCAELVGLVRFVPVAGLFFCTNCAKRTGTEVSETLRTFLARPFGQLSRAKLQSEEVLAGVDARELARFMPALAEHFEHRLDMRYPALRL